MPQLDQVTFFPQVFWLVVLFLLFYIIASEYYLPRISAALKLRAKYFQKVGGSLGSVLKEEVSLKGGLDKTLIEPVSYAKDFVSSASKGSGMWISNSLGEVHSSQWKSLNQDYLLGVTKLVGMSSLVSQYFRSK